jgi:hypothetical protein
VREWFAKERMREKDWGDLEGLGGYVYNEKIDRTQLGQNFVAVRKANKRQERVVTRSLLKK